MRKRERENPCSVCGHYHKFEDGEVCGICGHRLQVPTEKSPQQSAFSVEILPGFLYLGSYDNASRPEIMKSQGIKAILNTVPTCQNLFKNSFTYHCVNEDKALPFDECYEFLEKSRNDQTKVLVHCMSGLSRSPAIVIAYLMRHNKWRLAESYQFVKERKPFINISPAVMQSLQQYEAAIFGNHTVAPPAAAAATVAPVFPEFLPPPTTMPAFGFGLSAATDTRTSNGFVFGAHAHNMDSAS